MLSNHKTTLVPLESWAYCSPELKYSGKSIDIGLFAEALIYYDCVIVNPSNQTQLADFIQWFIRQDCLENFYQLLKDDCLKIYDYAFMTTAIEKHGVYSMWNIQDPIQAEANTFEQRYLYHSSIENLFSNARRRRKLYDALRENVIEVKANEFGSSFENARDDYKDPLRNSIVIQSFVDEIYKIRKLGKPPSVESFVTPSIDGSQHNITCNIDFIKLSEIAGEHLNFHKGTPLTALAHSNRFLWSAATIESDLYLPKPMSGLVGDKLYESTRKILKSGDLIEDLKAKVEFPDIRTLVNTGQLGFNDLITIRKKSKKFRIWLQEEANRDRDAIIAYHNEVFRESGLIKGARKALSMFGFIGGGSLGSAIGATIPGPFGGAIGGAVGGCVGYLADITSKIGAGWHPVVFGDWLKDRIEKITSIKE